MMTTLVGALSWALPSKVQVHLAHRTTGQPASGGQGNNSPAHHTQISKKTQKWRNHRRKAVSLLSSKCGGVDDSFEKPQYKG